MTRSDQDRDAATAALVALAADNIPTDIQELLVYGNPDRGVRPGALSRAIAAALRPSGEKGRVVVDHDRVVERLRAENEALRAQLDHLTITALATEQKMSKEE